MHDFRQVDVFGRAAFTGNPVAVVLDADDLSDAQMHRIANWTNLSETTFVQIPSTPDADYRVRIFTPRGEIPFAGHPSLGTAYALVESKRTEAAQGRFTQECGAGLIQIEVDRSNDEDKVFVTAPHLTISTIGTDVLREIGHIAHLDSLDDAEPLVIDVGPQWLTLRLPDTDTLSHLAPNMQRLSEFSHEHGLTGLTVYATTNEPGVALRVRSFAPAEGVSEDPVCGSGNICVAAHLIQTDTVSTAGYDYAASQGKEIGRDGLVLTKIDKATGTIIVGGRCQTRISGQIETRSTNQERGS